jgi:RHS repeat-associated protein
LRALLLVLASALFAPPAQASLPTLGDLARAVDELHARPSALAADLPRELPSELRKECNGPFCVEPLETRVGSFDLRLSCSVGGEAGLTCGSRPAYGLVYGRCAVERSVFTGHIWDEETGLYNAKARYFDPKLGRFLTQDSYLGQIDEPPSLHRYLYAADRPTFFVDPTGHGNETPGAKSRLPEDDARALLEKLSDDSQPWHQLGPQNAPEAAIATEPRSDCSGALCPVLEPVFNGGAWLLDNTLGRLTRWWDKRGKEAGAEVRNYIANQEPSERLLSGRKQMTQGLPEDILAADQGTQQLGTRGRETAGELGEAGTRTAVREIGVAVTMAGGSRALGEAAEATEQLTAAEIKESPAVSMGLCS